MSVEKVFEALASTPRRKILAYLAETSLTAGEIAQRFEMSRPAMSKHLSILEDAGLVRREKRGQYVHYRLADDNLVATLHTWLATICPVAGPLKREGAALEASRNDEAEYKGCP